MFGISFAKVLLLVAVVAAVWFAFRWFQRWEKDRNQVAEDPLRPRKRGWDERPGQPASTEEMTACKICGAFVAARIATSCGRPNCPY